MKRRDGGRDNKRWGRKREKERKREGEAHKM